ncbi:glycosyltransferase [Nocardioides sp. zg-ZUI104]|uniref:glycosyltransferase n=1 Tax=Nocardioides faecalis TaxID=2803858 RepID=UPI001BD10D99|nr:glycosyltransferase [Nocardioides faecalis]MBS4751881.1 glycosyltransferase [Nocardioides faecalis]
MSGRLLPAAAAGYLGLQSAKAFAALRSARKAPPARDVSPAEIARVVVVQPILSGDPGLEDALRDNLLALEGARFCWLVDTDDPEAQRVVARLADQLAAAPEGSTRLEVLHCAPAPPGTNPKLVKLQQALDHLAAEAPDDGLEDGLADRPEDRPAEVFCVLDDDTRLPRPALGALLDGLERARLVTGLPGYLPGRTVWAQLVEQFVDNNAALTYLPMAPVTINGMTWAMRSTDLQAMGGFTPLLHHLTDDLALAGAVLADGGTICQTATPQWITTTVASPGAYVRLMHRWMLFANLLLRRQPPRTVAAIGLLHGVHPMLLWGVLLGSVRRRRPGPALVLLLGRALLLRTLQRRIHGRVLHRPGTSLASELLQPVHLLHAAAQPTIRWRTRTYRVRADDDFTDARA